MTTGRIAILSLCLLVPAIVTTVWVNGAASRLAEAEQPAGDSPAVAAVAAASDNDYCTANLKQVLRRVLRSCGLLDSGQGTARGCQPVDAKRVATMAGDDFNALFRPMAERGGIIQFDQGDSGLSPDDTALIDELFADQRGASYFFVVARASPEGSARLNRDLSKRRAEAVMDHLRAAFNDPDLDREVGLLWLGEEFAQLDEEFCRWRRTGAADLCRSEELNRSAFIAWIDCRL
jgi:outer membrane protein OmpA-like peptidoglycan-associated protein